MSDQLYISDEVFQCVLDDIKELPDYWREVVTEEIDFCVLKKCTFGTNADIAVSFDHSEFNAIPLEDGQEESIYKVTTPEELLLIEKGLIPFTKKQISQLNDLINIYRL